MINYSQRIGQILKEFTQIHSVIPGKFLRETPFVFNFTKENKEILNIDPKDSAAFSRYITKKLERSGKILGIGKYGEDRTIYRSNLYTSTSESRSIHLAIDLFVPVGAEVFTPLDGIIHSFQDNNKFLDYGPTIILEHDISDIKFYTLYGHLNRTSLKGLIVGRKVLAGERIARVGRENENGSWPPHLHFQIITDLLGFTGDFPGVAKPSEKEYYLALCPDPNLLLRILPPSTNAF